MRTSQWVVYGTGERFRHAPFVPDVSVIDATPKVSFKNVSLSIKKTLRQSVSHKNNINYLFQIDRILQREENGEPAEHARRVSAGIDGEHHVFVEHRLKVTGESV